MTFLLFESLLSKAGRSFCFSDPELIIQADRVEDIRGALSQVQNAVQNGYFVAGFLTYEAGYAFLPHLPPPRLPRIPLAWFAGTKNPREVALDLPGGEHVVDDLRLNLDLTGYDNAIQTVRKQIELGHTYQVNFTMRYNGRFSGSPLSLYRTLKQKQRVDYAAYVETDEWAVVSLSPELFFEENGRKIRMKPMKGTASRGRNTKEDKQRAVELKESRKEQSENLMIVDLIRNDLGKICKTGSIEVVDPMDVELYETLLQMTSTVTGELGESVSVKDILQATFPSGSVTGAPKISTMQIIHELEKQPRGIYTGAIGFISNEKSVFNVAIRTAWIDRKQGTIEMGVGSGILYEADAEREYRECELKGKFLTEPNYEFSLIETMLWQPGHGIRYWELHLDRLCDSARYFCFVVEREQIEAALGKLNYESPHRIRLLLKRDGGFTFDAQRPDALSSEPRVTLSKIRTDSSDRFLYHKTTRREIYERQLQEGRKNRFIDVIFQNEKDQITEGAISNIMIRKGNVYFTPPVECGLLPGVFRRYLLESGSLEIHEQILYEGDLRSADAIYLTNAVRGMVEVKLV